MQKLVIFQKGRSSARLQREISSLDVRLQHFDSSMQVTAWHKEASAQLQQAKSFLGQLDVEGGWHCYQAANRLLINGLSAEELRYEAAALKEEGDKLTGWRRHAIEVVLGDLSQINFKRLTVATKLRDEYYANQYHKILLTSDQLVILCAISAGAIVAGLFALFFLPKYDDALTARTLTAVAFFGILGSAFSVGQSIIGMADSAKIPEYVANLWVTLMRSMFGAVTGVAGYMFYTSQIVRFTLGDAQNRLPVALSVAFIFGYAGEKLINKIVESATSARSER
jgi:hypothetical protein